jgi:hypothetical protein
MTFNTGNNVPSTDPRDLYDNAENLDKLVNGVDPFVADRLGKFRESWAGMENTFNNAQEGRENAFTASQADKESRFQAFLVSAGYVSKGDYAAGVVLVERNEYVAVNAATTGTTPGLYRPGPNATLPLTLTGTWATDEPLLRLLGDDVLRQELASASQGASMIGRAGTVVGSIAALKALVKGSASKHAFVTGYYAQGDGGGGAYYLDAADSVSADNGGSIIVAADGGRWKLSAPGFVSVRQYGAKGDGAADDTAAIQSAIRVFRKVVFPAGTYKTTGTIYLPTNSELIGTAGCTVDYAGIGAAFANETPGTRIYAWRVSELIVSTTTGEAAFAMDSVSTSEFRNVNALGFTIGFDLFSPTSGFCVYNRFYNCRGQGGSINYRLRGTSSNANVFSGCRAGGFSTCGFQLTDANDNTLQACQIESSNGNGVEFVGTAAGLTTGNRVNNCRFEGAMTYGIKYGTNCSNDVFIGNQFVSSVPTPFFDESGAGTYIRIDPFDARFRSAGTFGRNYGPGVVVSRNLDDGDVVEMRKGGALVGAVGSLYGGAYLKTAAATDGYLAVGSTYAYVWSATDLRPNTDNNRTLGTPTRRWSTIYAGTGTINTSDGRLKQEIRDVSEAERAVALRIKGMMKSFKFNDAVSDKGDMARIHFGVIAQDVKAAFEAEGLLGERYAMLCYDEWPEQEELLDGDGNVVREYQPAGNRYGVRYEELLAFVLAAL